MWPVQSYWSRSFSPRPHGLSASPARASARSNFSFSCNFVESRRQILTHHRLEVFGGSALLVPVPTVWIRDRGRIGILFELLGPQRLTDTMFLVEPFPEVKQFAATRTERPVWSGKPVPLFSAGRAWDF